MKKLFSALKYARHYKGYTALNVVFNIFYAVLSAAAMALLTPFIDLLFKNSFIDLSLVLAKGEPNFSFSSAYFQQAISYHLAGLILLKGKINALIFICIAFFTITFFKNTCRYFAMYFIAPIRNGVVRDLRNRMYKKALDLPLSYYSDEKKGDLMSRMTTDVQEIEWSIMLTLEMIFREPLTILIILSLMLLISTTLTLYILALLPFTAVFIGLIGKNLKNASRKSKTTLGQIISLIEETLGSLKVIKSFNASSHMGRQFEETNQKFFKESVNVYRKTDLGSPLTEIFVTAIMMLILFIGGNMVFNNEMSGALFITYLALATQIMPPIKQLTIAYNSIQKGIASEERINKILDAEIQIRDSKAATSLKGLEKHIRFNHVSFAYHKGDEGYVLKDIDLTITKGKSVAFVGSSGSGKTTLADMLPRFYDPDKGAVEIDGVDIRSYSQTSLRAHIGVVTQESILYNDSIYNNITFGMPNVTPEQVEAAARVANAHDFIVAWPEGYQTNIGDRGSKLSGGQKQRISIARAVLRNPEILILDEATSALDTESERLVQDALVNLMQGRTSIIIAHRLSTVVNADEIIVLDKGTIAERGTHNALLAQNGIYKRLCELQGIVG